MACGASQISAECLSLVFIIDFQECIMGLLDTVLGALRGGQQQAGGAAGGGLGDILGSMLGNVQGGGSKDLINAAIGMLGNDGAQGGLGGLVTKFQEAGLGDAMSSWIGTGANQSVDGDQITQALGSDTVGNIAAKLGINQSDVAGQLSQILPGLINHLTPNGQAPEGGLGNSGDLMGMLGGLLQKR
jgi:uncharacterized protein YidB (DUF937 family)